MPGLVLTPGTGGRAEAVWGHLRDRFVDRWKVVTPDLDDLDVPLELGQLVEQVAAAANAADAVPFDLVGYSFGTAVAAQLAADRGDHIRSLVLVAGMTDCDSRMRLQLGLWRDLFERDRESLARLAVQSCFSPSYLSAMNTKEIEGVVADFITYFTSGFARHIELGMRTDVEEACPRIRAPTLVIGLSGDHIVPAERTRALHDAIPGSSYMEIDSGHLIVFERPDELVSVLRDFLTT